MRGLISSCVIAVMLSSASPYAAPPSDPKAEKEVMAAMEAWRQAMLKKDGAGLAKLYHEDYPLRTLQRARRRQEDGRQPHRVVEGRLRSVI